MERPHTHALGDHGDLLAEQFICILRWMPVSSRSDNWQKAENERTACFYEYRIECMSFGPRSCPEKRVTWARELVDDEADQFPNAFLGRPDPEQPWLTQRMAIKIPYSA